MTKQPFTTTLENMIRDNAREIEQVEDMIRSHAAALARDVERVTDHLNRGFNLNEHGEIQTAGTKLDQYIARRQQLLNEHRRLSVLDDALNHG